MPIYRIAKLNIQIDPLYSQTEKRLAPFLSQTADYDFDASASAEEVKSYIEEKEPCPPYLAEGAIILTKICKTVLSDYSGMFFHSSSLMLDGEAYLFTALSGTGKSTHTALWRKRFGDRVLGMLNPVDGQIRDRHKY